MKNVVLILIVIFVVASGYFGWMIYKGDSNDKEVSDKNVSSPKESQKDNLDSTSNNTQINTKPSNGEDDPVGTKDAESRTLPGGANRDTTTEVESKEESETSKPFPRVPQDG
ncbi:MAG: hypothetical protein U5L10_01935 [Candidatus Moranbacteria bacterium]|nr:hypothetical protein [Candidatus Moranbacteria bacterium]